MFQERYVESYNIKDIKDKLHLDRQRLIVMGLLMGCDYKQGGVHQIGKATASELMKDLDDDVDVLARYDAC